MKRFPLDAYGSTFDIYAMDLLEIRVFIDTDTQTVSILRVPGGWLFREEFFNTLTSTFIPFNNEFQDKETMDIEKEFI